LPNYGHKQGLSPHHWQLANESSDTAFGMSGFTVSQLIDGDTVKNLNIEHFLADYFTSNLSLPSGNLT